MNQTITPQFGSFVGPWRPWFAWLPVQSWDGRWIWLRAVLRRRVLKNASLSDLGGADQWWLYATEFTP